MTLTSAAVLTESLLARCRERAPQSKGSIALTHEIVGKLTLGISPDEQPRWG